MEKELAQNLQEVMRNRAGMYHMLSRVFRKEVDDALLKELRSMHFPQRTGNDVINTSYKRLFMYLRAANEATVNNLAVEFARIFLGSGALDAHAAYPYESVYTSPKGLTMQDARDEVLAIYRSQGIDKKDTWRDPEDHIAAQLEFLKVLCQRADILLSLAGAGAPDTYEFEYNTEGLDAQKAEARLIDILETQRGFIKHHIFNWTPRFFDDITRYASQDFYPAFGSLTRAYLQEDFDLLNEILGPETSEEKEIETTTPSSSSAERN